MWFKKKSKSDTPINEFDDFRKEYCQLSSDIKYMKSQWNTYIEKSLEEDLSLYKGSAEHEGPNSDTRNKFWTMTRMESDTFRLKKCGERWKSLNLRCDYTFDDDNGKLSLRNVYCDGNELKSTKNLINILSKYFYLMKINNKKRSSHDARKQFDDMTKIVGKDTIRDARIDTLLEDLDDSDS
jgi:uncharacterized protein YutD